MYYSQFQEDKFLDKWGKLPKIGVFVDVGAGGIENSNSLFFEEKGWKVLCIEPDPRHEGLKDRKLVDNSIVGSDEGYCDFTFHRFPQLSGTKHKSELAERKQVHTLDSVLEKYGITKIDILSVDVEGSEMDVMAGFSVHTYRPTYIIIEHSNQFKGNCETETKWYLRSIGYEIVYATPSNFVAERVDDN